MTDIVVVGNFESARICIGVKSTTTWVRISENKYVELLKEDDLVHFLPCLEIEYKKFFIKMSAQQNLHFPYTELVAFGLKSGSEHWALCALSWIPEILPNDKISEALSFAAVYGKTQKIKQTAEKWHKQMQS